MINVHAVGRLTKGAELRKTNTGKSVANFTLACKRKRPDKERKVPTSFIPCVMWGKPAEAFAKFTQKGALIGVSGELQTRSYDDQQGMTHYVTELVVENFEFLESKETLQSREQKQHKLLPPHLQALEKEQDFAQEPGGDLAEYGDDE